MQGFPGLFVALCETRAGIFRQGWSQLQRWLQEQAALILPGALTVLALALPAYRYRLIYHHGTEDIFFELRDIFLFLSDFPAALAVAAWALTPFPRRVRLLPRWLVATLLLLAAWAGLSAIWAPMPLYAVYQAGRLWLLAGVFLVVATTWELRGLMAWALLISAALQAGIGLAQFLLQRTLGLRDLGEVTWRPDWPGASVITVDGMSTLRAYGLTQHPNLLGGILMAGTLLGIGLALSSRGRRAWIAIMLAAASFGGLLITFSRAAWLGLAGGAATALFLLWLQRRQSGLFAAGRLRDDLSDFGAPEGKATMGLGPAVGLVIALAAVAAVFVATQWPLLRPRLGLSVEGVEIRSFDERAVLEAATWVLIRENPWLGVGYGNFSVALWERRPAELAAYPIYQPVHRALLLAQAELGLPGSLFWLAVNLGPWLAMWHDRRRWPGKAPPALSAFIAGALLALTVVSWFDFYPWFSQQGRLLVWVLLGMWAGTMAYRSHEVQREGFR
ncbi:MAG: O-antigen ligase family protein [Anaerolineae bacterium]|nr:O-antigen ligase family protein [Anaerolineae bacterium]